MAEATELAVLEERVRQLKEAHEHLVRLVAGEPFERSIIGRLEQMEAASLIAGAASNAYSEAVGARRRARHDLAEARRRTLSWRWKFAGAITAAFVAAAPYVQIFYGRHP